VLAQAGAEGQADEHVIAEAVPVLPVVFSKSFCSSSVSVLGGLAMASA
jgi:hypothetical protein